MVFEREVAGRDRALASALFGRPAWLQATLDVVGLVLIGAVAAQVYDPDVLFHVLWIVLALEAFAFGLTVSLVRISIAAVLVFGYSVLAAGDDTALAAQLIDLDFEEWPLMIIIVLLVAVMAYRVTATGDRYAALYRQASDRLLRAQEDERRRLSADLHDGVGQMLTALTMTLDGASGRLRRSAPADRQQGLDALQRGRQLAADTLEEVRSVALRLRPQRLSEIGLVGAMSELAVTAGPLVVFEADPGLSRQGLLTPSRELEAYRIVQEALGNALRHAKAHRITMSAHVRAEGMLQLEVRDDGVGLVGRPHAKGLGLAGMRDRATAMDAQLSITSARGRGTAVRLAIPLAPGAVEVVRPDPALQPQGSRS